MVEMPKQKYLEFLKSDIDMNEILQVALTLYNLFL